MDRTRLIRLAYLHPELRPALLQGMRGRTGSATVTITNTTTGQDMMTDFFLEVVKQAMGSGASADVVYDKGIFRVTVDADDWNRDEPGETFTRHYVVEFKLRQHAMVVTSEGKSLKMPFDVFGGSVLEAGTLLRRLAHRLPSPQDSFTPDTPSLQDSAPEEYWTER